MMTNDLWEHIVETCNELYGSYVDGEERFFDCPNCREPIYQCDWTNAEAVLYCPICEAPWYGLLGEEDEDDEDDEEDWEEEEEEE